MGSINFNKVKDMFANKDNLTLWMNNLLVIYAFMLPISQTIKASVFTFIIIIFLLRGDVLSSIKETLNNKVVQAFIYFFLIYLLGLLWSEDLKEGIYALKSVKYGLYLIVFYAVVDGRYINRVVTAFLLGMLVSELTSYGMLLGVMPSRLELGDILFYVAPSLSDPSPFLNHIHYGVALALGVILIGHKVYYSKNPLVIKLFMSLFILSATANIFVTGGRTGYITFILLILTLAIFYLKRYAIAALLFLALVLGVAYNSSEVFKSKVIQTQDSVQKLFSKDADFSTSLGVRAGMYYFGYQVVKENPLLGAGTGDSIKAIQDIAPHKYERLREHMSHEHNQFLSTFVKLGVIGLLIFLNIFYQIFRFKQEDKELRFIMIFSTLAIAFGVLTTQFNLRFFMPLWVVMLAVSMISKERRTIAFELDDKKVFLQILAIGAVFSFFRLFNQLL